MGTRVYCNTAACVLEHCIILRQRKSQFRDKNRDSTAVRREQGDGSDGSLDGDAFLLRGPAKIIVGQEGGTFVQIG